MKRFHIIKKASPVNYALESSRTLDNGVVLKLIHCGETLTVSASYESIWRASPTCAPWRRRRISRTI